MAKQDDVPYQIDKRPKDDISLLERNMAEEDGTKFFDLSDGGQYNWLNSGINNLDSAFGPLKDLFLNQVKNIDGYGLNTFFSDYSPISSPDSAFLGRMAVGLISSSISSTSDRGFNKTIDGSKANSLWSNSLTTVDAKNYYQNLFDLNYGPSNKQNGIDGINYLVNLVTSKPWMVGVGTIAAQNKIPNYVNKMKLILHRIQKFDSKNKRLDVENIWSTGFLNDYIVKLDSDQWLGQLIAPTLTTQFQNDMYLNDVNTAINKSTSKTQNLGNYPYPAGEGPIIPWIMEITTYGQDTLNWINNYAKSQGVATGKSPDNVVNKQISPPTGGGGGCFSSDTEITLDNRKNKKIYLIRNDDKVLSKNGKIGIVSDDVIKIRLSNDKEDGKLYGLNEDKPFFTAAHPFWTDEGWKSINPAITNKENPWIKAKTLRVGDCVYKLIGDGSKKYKKIRIHNIHGVSVKYDENNDENNFVYGLHLVNSISYHANGYLVGMNYPRFTAKRIENEIKNNLTLNEQNKLRQQLLPSLPLISKAMGQFIAEPLTNALGSDKEEKVDSKEPNKQEQPTPINQQTIEQIMESMKKKHVSINQMAKATFNVRCRQYIKSAKALVAKDFVGYSNDGPIKSIMIDHGNLYLNNVHIAQVVENKNCISFDTTYAKGLLFKSDDATLLHGTVTIKQSKDNNLRQTALVNSSVNATANINGTYNVVATRTVKFNTQISSNTYDTSDWTKMSNPSLQSSYILEYGYQFKKDSNNNAEYVRVLNMYPNNSEKPYKYDVDEWSTSIDNGHLFITINTTIFDPSSWPNMPATANFRFDDTMTSFIGSMQNMDDLTTSKYRYYKGSYVEQPAFFKMEEKTEEKENQTTQKSTYKIKQFKSEPRFQQTSIQHPVISNTKFEPVRKDLVSHYSTRVLDAPGVFTANAVDTDLNLEDLKSIYVDPMVLQKYANNLLMNNVKYCIDQDWLEKFFGESTKPEPDNKEAVDKAKEFYVRFGIGLIGQMINKNINYLGELDKRKLDYFLTNYLGSDNDYNTEMQRLYIVALESLSPRLREYMQNGKNWGQKLYDNLSSGDGLNNLIATVRVNNSYDQVNRYCTILIALDQSELSHDLNANVFHQIISATALTSVTQSDECNDSLIQYMIDYFNKFIFEFEKEDPDGSEESKMKTKMAQAMLEECEKIMKESGKDYYDSMSSLAGDAVNMWVALKNISGSMTDKIALLGTKFTEAHPTLTKFGQYAAKAVGGLISTGLRFGAMFLIITQFQQWDALSLQSKVSLVTNAVYIGADSIVGMIKFAGKEYVDWMKTKATTEEGNEFRVLFGEEPEEMSFTKYWKSRGLYSASEETFAEIAPKLATFLEYATIVMDFLNVCVAGVVAGISMYQFIKALKSDQYTTAQKVLLGIQAIAATIEFGIVAVGFVAGLVAAETIAAICSVAAPIFAVIGIVVMIVFLFIKPPKPDPNAWKKEWIDKNLTPILNNITIPTGNVTKEVKAAAQWVADQMTSKETDPDKIKWKYNNIYSLHTSTISDHEYNYNFTIQLIKYQHSKQIGDRNLEQGLYSCIVKEVDSQNDQNQWIPSYTMIQKPLLQTWGDTALKWANASLIPTYFNTVVPSTQAVFYWNSPSQKLSHAEFVPGANAALAESQVLSDLSPTFTSVYFREPKDVFSADRLLYTSNGDGKLYCGKLKLGDDEKKDDNSLTDIQQVEGVSNCNYFTCYNDEIMDTQYLLWYDTTDKKLNCGQVGMITDSKENYYQYDGTINNGAISLFLNENRDKINKITYGPDKTEFKYRGSEYTIDKNTDDKYSLKITIKTQNGHDGVPMTSDIFPFLADINVSIDFKSFTGTATTPKEGKQYPWNGTSSHEPNPGLRHIGIVDKTLVQLIQTTDPIENILSVYDYIDDKDTYHYIVYKEGNQIKKGQLLFDSTTKQGKIKDDSIKNYDDIQKINGIMFYGADRNYEYIVVAESDSLYKMQLRLTPIPKNTA